jgi:uncharacterized surface protein with fasciclin (FAS1) repeats
MNHVHVFLGGALALGIAATTVQAQQASDEKVPQVAATQSAAPAPQQVGTVFDAMMADPRFSETMQMVFLSGGANRLETAGGPLTVFAATNQGWQGGDFGTYLGSLTSTGAVGTFPQSVAVTEILRGFFVHGSPTLQQGGVVGMRSAAGRPIAFDQATMTVKWTDQNGASHEAKVDGKPILARNGVIYPVDAVVGS